MPVMPAMLRSISPINSGRLVLSPVSEELSAAGFSFIMNAAVAVPFADTMPIVCSPAGSAATKSAFRVTIVLPDSTV